MSSVVCFTSPLQSTHTTRFSQTITQLYFNCVAVWTSELNFECFLDSSVENLWSKSAWRGGLYCTRLEPSRGSRIRKWQDTMSVSKWKMYYPHNILVWEQWTITKHENFLLHIIILYNVISVTWDYVWNHKQFPTKLGEYSSTPPTWQLSSVIAIWVRNVHYLQDITSPFFSHVPGQESIVLLFGSWLFPLTISC